MFKNFFRVDNFFGARSYRAPKREAGEKKSSPRKTEAQIIPASVKSRDDDKKKSSRLGQHGL
jgi:hypothetical protein